jgi:hypothetical protein
MHRCVSIGRTCLRLVAVVSVWAGLLPGCGSGGSSTSQNEPPSGGQQAPKLPMAKQAVAKNVNAKASNRGLKGKYAD